MRTVSRRRHTSGRWTRRWKTGRCCPSFSPRWAAATRGARPRPATIATTPPKPIRWSCWSRSRSPLSERCGNCRRPAPQNCRRPCRRPSQWPQRRAWTGPALETPRPTCWLCRGHSCRLQPRPVIKTQVAQIKKGMENLLEIQNLDIVLPLRECTRLYKSCLSNKWMYPILKSYLVAFHCYFTTFLFLCCETSFFGLRIGLDKLFWLSHCIFDFFLCFFGMTFSFNFHRRKLGPADRQGGEQW